MRELGRGDDRRIGDLDAVVHFIALLQAAQDRDRVLDARLVHQHFLEAALERGILLDVLAIFVERGRADAMQLAARERGLQHVARIHGAFGLAGADHGVQLVDEQDDLAFLLRQILQHGLQPLFEFAAEFRAGDQRAHVEREDLLVLETLGHFAVDDALREAFDDRRLAHAGLADQHRIVLRAALEDLDRATDLVVATDDRIELAARRALGEIDGVFRQRFAALFRVRIVDGLAAAHFVDGLLELRLRRAGAFEDAAELTAVVERGERDELAGDVLVAALLRELVDHVEQPRQIRRHVHFAGRAFHLRQAVEQRREIGAQLLDVRAGLGEQGPQRAALLVEQREQQVARLDLLVVAPDGERLGVGQGVLEAAGEFVVTHAHLLGAFPRGLQEAARESRYAVSLRRAQCGATTSTSTMTPTPAAINSTWSTLSRVPTRRCSPGMRSATATYSRQAAATPSA